MIDALLPLLVEGGIKSLLLLTLTTLVAATLRGASAHIRHRVWGVTLLGLLILPVGTLMPPSWSFPVPLPEGWAASAGEASGIGASPSNPGDPRNRTGSRSGPVAAAGPVIDTGGPITSGTTGTFMDTATDPGVSHRGRSRASRALPVVGLWLIGGMLTAGWFAWGHWRIRRIGRRARVASSPWQAHLDGVAHRLGLSRPVDLRVAPGCGSPVTWGARRPVLLLPEAADRWPEEGRTLTLEHELLHVQRRDWLWEVVAQAACVVYWLNPLVWYAARRHAIEREHACDEAVLAAGATPSVYAAHLLNVARHLKHPTLTPSVGMAGHSKLEERLVWIHKMSRRERPAPRPGPVWASVLALVAILAGAEPWSASHGPRAAGPDPKRGTVASVQVAGDDTVSVLMVDPSGAVGRGSAVVLTDGAGLQAIALGDEGDSVIVLRSDGMTASSGELLFLDPDGEVTALPADSVAGNVFTIGSDGLIRAIHAGENDVVVYDSDTDEFVVATDEHTVLSDADMLLCLRDGLIYVQNGRIGRVGDDILVLDHEDAFDIGADLGLDEVLHVDPAGRLTRGGPDLGAGDGLFVRTRDGHTLRLESAPVLVTTDGDIVHTRVTGRVVVDPDHPDHVIPDPGSSVVFETDRGARRLEVSATPAGKIELQWSIDGVPREVDDEARDLLRAIVDLCGDG